MKDYQWAYGNKAQQLNQIMEKLENFIEIKDDANIVRVIIPDNYKEIVGIKLLQGLSKEFYTYTNYHYDFILESSYKKKQEEWKKELKLKKKKDQKQKENAQKAEGLRYSLENWRDESWIKGNIGEYFTWQPQLEYFWTIIGDNWQVASPQWKGNIVLEQKIYKKIEQMEFCGLKGSTFLNRKFKNKKGYSAGIVGTYKEKPQHYGVYGIKVNDELIYIGSTMREFEERFQEHKEAIVSHSKALYVYSLLKEVDTHSISIEIMFDCGEVVSRDGGKTGPVHVFTEEEVKSIEFGYIQLLKPKGNLAGKTMPFIY